MHTYSIPEATELTRWLHQAGQFSEAEQNYRQILAAAPQHYELYNDLGAVLVDQGRISEALECFDQCLAAFPEYVEAHVNRAINRLLTGDYERGLPEYEWRFRFPHFPPRRFGQPVWDGSPLAGKTILLHAEQGLGDTLASLRFVRRVVESGGRVIVECQRPLKELITQSCDQPLVVAKGEPLPGFDVHAPLMTLPGILGVTPATVSANVPYLQADEELVSHWRARLNDVAGRRIGIAWQGNPEHPLDRRRSTPLASFAPLAGIDGVTLVSLQKGPGTEQLASAGFPVTQLDAFDEERGAFVDTAAIMRTLDLVITTDTAIAHLAGALGVPVWVTLSKVPDWRWMLDRDDSPWYPSARLFRQHAAGEWHIAFQQVAAQLHSEQRTKA